MNEWVQNVVSKWYAEGVKINDGASLNDVEKLESALDFKFPDDFKAFYLAINGFKHFDMEEHLFTLWSLEVILEEINQSRNKDFVGFCDYLIASHCIGFKKSEKGIFKQYQTVEYEEITLIAETFEELIAMINSGAQSLY